MHYTLKKALLTGLIVTFTPASTHLQAADEKQFT